MNRIVYWAGVIAVIAAPAFADTRTARVTHVEPNYTNTQVRVPTTQCNDVKVPIYGTVQRQGNAGEAALTGMIIGGLVGKGATGKDDVAAAGAVIGGIIGANRSQTRTEQVITGYQYERQCNQVMTTQTERQIRNYTVTYEWNGVKGTSYTYNQYRVGDRIQVTVNIVAQ